MDDGEGSKGPPPIRVVTWNLLCPGLCDIDEFPRAKSSSHLDPVVRLKAIRERIRTEVRRGAVICLQELSPEWYSALLVDMDDAGYTMIPALEDQGSPPDTLLFGVAVCFPSGLYELLGFVIHRIGGGADGAFCPSWQRDERRGGPLMRVGPRFYSARGNVGDAASRPNRMIAVKLRARGRGDGETRVSSPFVIATYHMPCAFRNTTVMALHASAVVRCARAFADNGDIPMVLAGDFNCVPGDPIEVLLRTGVLPARILARVLSDNYGALAEEDVSCGRSSALSPAVSVDESGGGYTVYADTRRNGVFVGILDYIWISSHFRVSSPQSDGKPPPKYAQFRQRGQREMCEPMPNDKEPSDHLLLAVDLDMIVPLLEKRK